VTFADLIRQVIALLDASAVAYMITGSLASSYHGEPRATRDLDIVIDPSPLALNVLVDSLRAADFYVDRAAASAALSERTQFNAIGPDATKVDFIVRKDRPFSVNELARRRSVDLLGTEGFITSAEDLILAKLEWAAGTGSQRQLLDVEGIVAASTNLDDAYIEEWASRLGVLAKWRSIRDETGSARRF
jgi:hypothetical protein